MAKANTAEKIRNLFSRFTLVVTIAFGLITTLTLIEEPSRTLQPMTSSLTGGRSLASLTSTISPALANKPFMSTFEADCADSSVFKTPSQHVRIKGTDCGVESVLTSVKNTSNGYAATVFHQGGKVFTTDYMSLAEGENTITIEQKLANGEMKTREVKIIRE
jgi:hypothetical protein